MLNKNDFFNYIKDHVTGYLPPVFENGRIELVEMIKDNDIKLTSINIVKQGENSCPAIYLDSLYKCYTDGKKLDECVADVADIRIERDVSDLVKKLSYLDYSTARKNLMIRMCDPEWNKERLLQAVHTMHGDYAAIYYLRIEQDNVNFATELIKPEMLKSWGVSEEQLHVDAMDAERKRCPILCNITDIIDEMIFGIEPINMFLENESNIPGVMENPLYVLTNADRMNGASLILQEDLLEQIGNIIKTDYYILPSSCHQVMILPAFTEIDITAMTEIVKDINVTEVEPQDRFSEKVQYYSRETKTLENAFRREARLEVEKEKQAGKSIKERITSAKKEVSAVPTAKSGQRTKSMEAEI